jgi:hypothetical protein
MVTDVPIAPELGVTLASIGRTENVSLKGTPLLASPPTVTTTFPLAAPLGTGTKIEFELQPVGVAKVPLKVTVLVPCAGPKFVPVIVTTVPAGPEMGEIVAMSGATDAGW